MDFYEFVQTMENSVKGVKRCKFIGKYSLVAYLLLY